MQLYTYKIQTSLEWLSVRGHTTFPALLVPQKPTGGAKVSIIQDYIHNNQPVRIFLSKIFTKQNCNIIHRMASVHSSIDKYCRVCGGLLQKKKKQTQYSCATHREKLKETFEIDTSGDDSDIHPTHFCNTCYSVVRRQIAASREGIPYGHSIVTFQWQAHTEENCMVRSCLT